MLQKRFFTLTLGLIGAVALTGIYSCNKNSTTTAGVTPTPPVTDKDGNVYKTVKIGNQVWMAQPLRVTQYNDGTPIPYIVKGSAWAAATSGARCYYGNNVGGSDVSNADSAKYAVPYGALYNFAAVKSGKLAPAGYHIPDTSDFKILINYLGGPNIAGQFLKSAQYWRDDFDSSYSSRNNTDFTALPSGYRNEGGYFYTLGTFSYFWSSTEIGATMFYEYLCSNNPTIITVNSNRKTMGLSVVCVRD